MCTVGRQGGGFLEEEDLGLKSENVQEETRHRGAGTSQRNGIFTFKKVLGNTWTCRVGLWAVGVGVMASFAFILYVFQVLPTNLRSLSSQEVCVREGTPRGSGMASSRGPCPLIALGPVQAANCGADPPSGVCSAPARRGRLPELVHPRGHQREEVCALSIPCPGGEILGRCFPSLHVSL